MCLASIVRIHFSAKTGRRMNSVPSSAKHRAGPLSRQHQLVICIRELCVIVMWGCVAFVRWPTTTAGTNQNRDPAPYYQSRRPSRYSKSAVGFPERQTAHGVCMVTLRAAGLLSAVARRQQPSSTAVSAPLLSLGRFACARSGPAGIRRAFQREFGAMASAARLVVEDTVPAVSKALAAYVAKKSGMYPHAAPFPARLCLVRASSASVLRTNAPWWSGSRRSPRAINSRRCSVPQTIRSRSGTCLGHCSNLTLPHAFAQPSQRRPLQREGSSP